MVLFVWNYNRDYFQSHVTEILLHMFLFYFHVPIFDQIEKNFLDLNKPFWHYFKAILSKHMLTWMILYNYRNIIQHIQRYLPYIDLQDMRYNTLFELFFHHDFHVPSRAHQLIQHFQASPSKTLIGNNCKLCDYRKKSLLYWFLIFNENQSVL